MRNKIAVRAFIAAASLTSLAATLGAAMKWG